MQVPLQVKSPHVPLTGEVEAYIREKVDGLETVFDGIISCRVTIDGPVNHHQKGGPYAVQIDVVVPGAELVVSNRKDENLHAAIRESFDAMRKQIIEYVEKRKETGQGHVAPPRGRVVQLFPDEGYGFIETDDGRTLYFHRNAVIEPGFERLEVGTRVRFAEEAGEEGPQASTVAISG